MSERTCPTCAAPVPVRAPGKSGPARTYCSDDCQRRRYRLPAQEERPVVTCPVCAKTFVQKRIDGVTCSRTCWYRYTDRMLVAPPLRRICALPGCDVEFQPRRPMERCCCEQHGKNLWNRESRADGRQTNSPWTDSRRDSYHRRRALKKATSTGAPVLLAEIARRDRWTCHLCRRPICMTVAWPDPLSPSLDHVVPLSRGGTHEPANVKLAHLSCNTIKGNREAA